MNNIILSSVSLDELNASIAAIIEQALEKRFQQFVAPKQEELLTRKQAAKILGVSLPTLNNWTKEGIVIAHRINTRVRYKQSELEAALKQIKSVRYR